MDAQPQRTSCGMLMTFLDLRVSNFHGARVYTLLVLPPGNSQSASQGKVQESINTFKKCAR